MIIPLILALAFLITSSCSSHHGTKPEVDKAQEKEIMWRR
jgi:PBP1b-binding outer membrane lipoprotein LpoB